jgi:hypothetical protein
MGLRAFAALTALALGAGCNETQTTFWVSPDGDDGAAGTEQQPFATPARARDAVRAVNDAQHDYVVWLRGGTFRLSEPLRLDARDGGGDGHLVRWLAAPGEVPVLSGGIEAFSASSGVRHVYVGDVRVPRRREPMAGAVAFADSDDVSARAGYHVDGAPAWADSPELEVGWYLTWSHKICPVDRVEPSAAGGVDVVLLQPCFYLATHDDSGRQVGAPDYVEIGFDAPPADEMIVPSTEELLDATGSLDTPVQNLLFAGLTFAHAAWRRTSDEGLADVQAGFVVDMRDPTQLLVRNGNLTNVHNELRKADAAVVVDAARNVVFEACHFTHLGGAAINVQHGAREVTIRDSTFDDISASAIQIGDVRRDDHHPTDPRAIVASNNVIGNTIHDIGVEFEDSVAIFVGYTDSTVITGNTISDIPYTGISVGWGWGEEDPGGGANQPFSFDTPTTSRAAVIRENTLTRVLQRRTDGGAIYTLGAQPGTVIEGNVIADAAGWPGGIYLDEGSQGITVGENTISDVQLPFFDHSTP